MLRQVLKRSKEILQLPFFSTCKPYSTFFSMTSQILDGVPVVDIDGVGQTFKYILLKLTVQPDGQQKTTSDNERVLVRGYSRCPFHGDIFDEVHEEVAKRVGKNVAFDLKCLGGGRIKHTPKNLLVYGYSQGYGRADHQITTNLLKARYESEGYVITFSNDGY